jgi:hypothetical protein
MYYNLIFCVNFVILIFCRLLTKTTKQKNAKFERKLTRKDKKKKRKGIFNVQT